MTHSHLWRSFRLYSNKYRFFFLQQITNALHFIHSTKLKKILQSYMKRDVKQSPRCCCCWCRSGVTQVTAGVTAEACDPVSTDHLDYLWYRHIVDLMRVMWRSAVAWVMIWMAHCPWEWESMCSTSPLIWIDHQGSANVPSLTSPCITCSLLHITIAMSIL